MKHTGMLLIGLLLTLPLTGCVAMIYGTHQDIAFESKVPDVQITLDRGAATCVAPCTLNVRRQWASFHMTATHDGEMIAEGPIYRRRRGAFTNCTDGKEIGIIFPYIGDALLLVPGIVDISTGILSYHPERVVIEKPGTYLLYDSCWDGPKVGGYEKGFKGDGQ